MPARTPPKPRRSWGPGYLLDEYGNAEAALTAYRWGQDNGSRDYARTVLAAAERWAAVLEA